ncbi:CBS domain-containing protein [Siccirubricoccus sp. KC 17139]|uniref:CBS domain-containing protein n=1 Tax=Siccirubricoccus soli TaxID=2899147 RepID=A0ABT1D8B0_9PROT|nr:CBS domain-containing protein [Siccirubricoccus soli]MCO6418175.1 CBS domain-containing protein [Siccirubricoccus soli]MCP2684310.1 CBS domain-containing protein [Siccirubricoccus soli]
MLARDLMTPNPVTVPPEAPVTAVAELLARRGISAVPVVDAAGKPLGIVTEGDLIRRLADAPPGPLTWFLDIFRDPTPLAQRYLKAHGAVAREVMTTPLVTVGQEASAEEISRLMEKHRIRRVLVEREGVLVGLVSRADLLRAVLRAAQPDSARLEDRAVLHGILAAFREQPWTDTFWVFPDVAGGRVTLYGFARSEVMREGLKRLAAGVAGVRAVEDRMTPMPLILRAML